jgi:hypothetical protein
LQFKEILNVKDRILALSFKDNSGSFIISIISPL